MEDIEDDYDLYGGNEILEEQSEETDDENNDQHDIDDETIKVEITTLNTFNSVEKYKPHITRDFMSIYEYARVITALAKYLYDVPDLSQYIGPEDNPTIINPCELACQLFEENKFDCILDRGCEKVTFSELRFNIHWKDMLQQDFDKTNNSIKKDLLEKLKLI